MHAALRRCSASPACATYTPGGRPCPACRRKRDQQRDTATARGYDAEWRALRLVKLARDPVCERCRHDGIRVAASEVNHRIPVRVRPDLRLTIANLESLCHACHSRDTTARSSGSWNRKQAPI